MLILNFPYVVVNTCNEFFQFTEYYFVAMIHILLTGKSTCMHIEYHFYDIEGLRYNDDD